MKNKIKILFKENYKAIITIVLYFLFQYNVSFLILNKLGLDINNIKRPIRIICFTLNDLLYVLIVLFIYRKDIIKGIKDLRGNFDDRSFIAIKCWAVGCVLMTISSVLIALISKQNVSNNEKLIRESIKLAPIYMFISCSIVAPVFEELVFRKSIYELIKKKTCFTLLYGIILGSTLSIKLYNPLSLLLQKMLPNTDIMVLKAISLYSLLFVLYFLGIKLFKIIINKLDNNWVFIVISGVSFGLLHIIGSYTSPLDLLYVIPYGVMGSCFAYLLTKTKNISLPIIVHMLHNTILVITQILGWK